LNFFYPCKSVVISVIRGKGLAFCASDQEALWQQAICAAC